MKGLTRVIVSSKRAARWRRTAQALCEDLLRRAGATGREARVVDGYLIVASKVGRLATGRITPLGLLVVSSGTTNNVQYQGLPVLTDGVDPYNLVYSWSDRDAFELWAEDWEAWYDPTDPSPVDRGTPPLPLKLVGRFYADVIYGPDVGPVMYWTTTPLVATDAVVTAAGLTSSPRGPDQDFIYDLSWDPDADLFVDVQLFRPGGVTKFRVVEDEVTGEEVVDEVPPAGAGPTTLRFDRFFVRDHAGGFNLTARDRHNQLGGELAWAINIPTLDSTPERRKVVTFVPVYQERWPGASWPGNTPASPFEYYGVQGLLVIQSVVTPPDPDHPADPEHPDRPHYEWFSDFISPENLPHPDMQRRPAEAVQGDPDWFGELRPNGEVDSDSRRRGSFCRLASRQGAAFEGDEFSPGGVALLVDVRHYTDSLADIGLEPPGPPAPGGIPPEYYPEWRMTYTSGLLLVRVFDDGVTEVTDVDTFTNDPAAGKVLSVAAAHTLDGKAVFHVLRGVCTDQERIDLFLERQWYGGGGVGAPTVPFGRHELVTYHIDGHGVDKYVVVPDVSLPEVDFVHLDYRWWEHLPYYNVSWDHGIVGTGVSYPSMTYWRYGNVNNPAVSIDQYRAIVFMRSYNDVEQAGSVFAGWTLAYMYDSRDQTYEFISVLAESSFVSHVTAANVLQYAVLDPETQEEVTPATIVVAGEAYEGAGVPNIGRMFVSRNSGRTWTLVANLAGPGGFQLLGNAALRVKPGQLFD